MRGTDTLPPRRPLHSGRSSLRRRWRTSCSAASIVATKGVSKGVTDARRVTLSDGRITHDAQVQDVDIFKADLRGGPKNTEVNFRDTYRYNIAAYRLSRLLGLDNVPMSVLRRVDGKPAAVTWWIDDVAMDEGDRQKKQVVGPNPSRTAGYIHILRVFDELIQNRDRNAGNLLWTKDWTMWMIDHTRAFRLGRELLKPELLDRCERTLLDRMRGLTAADRGGSDGRHPDEVEIDALMARRDRHRQAVRRQDCQARRGGGALHDASMSLRPQSVSGPLQSEAARAATPWPLEEVPGSSSRSILVDIAVILPSRISSADARPPGKKLPSSMPVSSCMTRPPNRGVPAVRRHGMADDDHARVQLLKIVSTSGERCLVLERETAIPQRSVFPGRQQRGRLLGVDVWRDFSSDRTVALMPRTPDGATAGLTPPCMKTMPLILTIVSRSRSQWPYSPSGPNASTSSTKPIGVCSRNRGAEGGFRERLAAVFA